VSLVQLKLHGVRTSMLVLCYNEQDKADAKISAPLSTAKQGKRANFLLTFLLVRLEVLEHNTLCVLL